MQQKFFIVDGHALVYRSYFAFINNPRITTTNINTSAIYGFTNTILEILNIEKPEFLAVVFDTKKPTWRHTSFKEYKSTRPKQPDAITASFPYIKNILKAMNIKFYEEDGFEADDLAGTMTKIIPEDIDIFIMTPDKDYAQLVKKNVFLFRHLKDGKYHKLDTNYILQKWEIEHIDQVRDILALQGDNIDNVPGIPGIGEKTAKKLVSEYGSVENIINNANNILPEKIRKNILEFKDQCLLSKKLVTITTNVDFGFNLDDCRIKNFNDDDLLNILTKLEFVSIIKKIKNSDLKRMKMEKQLDLF